MDEPDSFQPVKLRVVSIALLTTLAIFLNFVAMATTGMLMWIGGPIFWYGQFWWTIGLALVLFVSALNPKVDFDRHLLAGIIAWPIGMILLVVVGDGFEVRGHQSRLVADYETQTSLEIPPGCGPDAPYRAMPYIEFRCDGTLDQTVARFRKFLGPDWGPGVQGRCEGVVGKVLGCVNFVKDDEGVPVTLSVYDRDGETKFQYHRGSFDP